METKEEILLKDLRKCLENYTLDDKYHFDVLSYIYYDCITGHKRVTDDMLIELEKEYPLAFQKLDLNGEFQTNNWGSLVARAEEVCEGNL